MTSYQFGIKKVIERSHNQKKQDINQNKEQRFIHNNLLNWKPFFAKFWEFPKVKHSIEINVTRKKLRIDEREFEIPLLIELNENLETILRFSSEHEGHSLLNYRKKIPKNKYFFLIDNCSSFKKISKLFNKTLGEQGFCLATGIGPKYTNFEKLEKINNYNIKEIKIMLGFK